jgi:hypothetical protein
MPLVGICLLTFQERGRSNSQQFISMSTEKRKATRRNLERSCWMQLAPNHVIPSSISNISQTGAKLNLPEDVELPEQFDLLLTRDGSVARKVELAWRSEETVGLKFVDGRIVRPVMPDTEPDTNAPATDAAT